MIKYKPYSEGGNRVQTYQTLTLQLSIDIIKQNIVSFITLSGKTD